MRKNDRHGARAFSLDVKKVNVEILDAGDELREAVEALLGFAPVVTRGPVGGELLQVIVIGAVLPAAFEAIGPARFADAREDAVERLLGNGDAKRARGGAGCFGEELPGRRHANQLEQGTP